MVGLECHPKEAEFHSAADISDVTKGLLPLVEGGDSGHHVQARLQGQRQRGNFYGGKEGNVGALPLGRGWALAAER